MYPRTEYLNKLIAKRNNGRIKIITGLRRSGKSVLLFKLYKEHLLNEGVSEDQIITIALDVLENVRYRNPIELDKYIRERMINTKKQYYILIDEIQFVAEIQNPYVDNPDAKISFIDVILGFMQMQNADVYVTGSDSKMLSSDVDAGFDPIYAYVSDTTNAGYLGRGITLNNQQIDLFNIIEQTQSREEAIQRIINALELYISKREIKISKKHSSMPF